MPAREKPEEDPGVCSPEETRLCCTAPLTFVPRLPVLPSAPNVGNSQDSAQMADEDEPGDAVAGRDGNIKASVAVEEPGVGAVQFDTLLVDDKHGDLSSVLGGIEDLAKENKPSGLEAKHGSS